MVKIELTLQRQVSIRSIRAMIATFNESAKSKIMRNAYKLRLRK